MDIVGIYDKVVSHALTLGVFENFPQHEPKSAPGKGITGALWVQEIGPAPKVSGLSETSARVTFTVRIYQNMMAEPQDDTDPNMLAALDALLTSYSGDFNLDGVVFAIDLLGAWSPGLSAKAGYLNQDSKLYRVIDVTLPLIVDAVWTQGSD